MLGGASESDDDQEYEYDWRSLSWGGAIGLKAAFQARGLAHGKYPTNTAKRRQFAEDRAEELREWENNWRGGARPAPEFMSADELQAELAELDYEYFTDLDTATGEELDKHRKLAIKIIATEHGQLQQESMSGEESGSEGDLYVDVDNRVHSHPEGMIGATQYGKNRLFFAHDVGSPTTRTSAEIRETFGRVIGTYSAVDNTRLRDMGLSARLPTGTNITAVQQCQVITGVRDGGNAEDFDLELVNLLHNEASSLDPRELVKFPTMPTLADAFEYANMKLEYDPDLILNIAVMEPKFNLDEGIIPMLDLPKLLDCFGKDLGRPHHSPN